VIKSLSIILLAFFIEACVPMPHKAFRTPFIFGEIAGNSDALAATRVRAIAAPVG
jgi:hypothetical protein